MRKNLIALSAAAFVGGLGLAGSATASVIVGTATATGEEVRQSGTGHQLIVHYFNTQSGNATLFNIVNADTVNGKAVKIRFRGASNSDDVFDFQLYMSPADVWTANISKGPNGMSRLTTIDKSCTLPSGVGSGAGSDFVTARLPATLTGDALNAETREGYIEVFNMADIPPATASNSLFKAIVHVSGTPPCTAATMNTLQANPTTQAAANTLGLFNPTTGLFANWTIVNVPKSGSATGEATAITATIPGGLGGLGRVPGVGNIVFFPQIGGAAPTPDVFTADPGFRTVAGTTIGLVSNGAGAAFSAPLPIIPGGAQFFDLPDLSTPYLLSAGGVPFTGSQADPINYINILQGALATSSITNEFLTDTSINAFTDWTFSSPTRRYSVVPDYRPLTASTPGPILKAFDAVNAFYQDSNTTISGFQICITTAGVTYFDREEFTAVGTSFVISPNPPVPGFRLCGEVSTLTFNSPTGSSVLGSTVAKTNFATPGAGSTTVRDGWAVVGLPGLSGNGIGGVNGLPVIGKSFSAASTGSFNVGGSWEHRYTPTFPD